MKSLVKRSAARVRHARAYWEVPAAVLFIEALTLQLTHGLGELEHCRGLILREIDDLSVLRHNRGAEGPGRGQLAGGRAHFGEYREWTPPRASEY